MADDRTGDDRTSDDDGAPARPFRPWTGSGVAQPGASRPRTVPDELPRPVPRPDPTRDAWAPPAAPLAPPTAPAVMGRRPPMARAGAPTWKATTPGGRATLASRRAVLGLAVLSALTAWLPWFKPQTVGVFELTGGARGSSFADAWDLPASYLWSTHGPAGGGIELGWLVLALPLLMVLACIRGWRRGAVIGIAAGQAAVALLFVGQTFRLIDDASARTGIAFSYGATDLLGFAPYALLVLSVALVVAPRR